MEDEVTVAVGQDSRNLALLVWLGSIFFGFVPSLLVYLVKKDDPYVQDQSREALNWCITAAFGYLAGVILTYILVGVLVFAVVGICNLVFCIMGAVAASRGGNFRVPFAIRLVK